MRTFAAVRSLYRSSSTIATSATGQNSLAGASALPPEADELVQRRERRTVARKRHSSRHWELSALTDREMSRSDPANWPPGRLGSGPIQWEYHSARSFTASMRDLEHLPSPKSDYWTKVLTRNGKPRAPRIAKVALLRGVFRQTMMLRCTSGPKCGQRRIRILGGRSRCRKFHRRRGPWGAPCIHAGEMSIRIGLVDPRGGSPNQ